MVKKCFEKRIDNIIPLIMFTSLRLEALADHHIFKPFGFTSASFRIMALIDRLGPSSPSRIIELLGSGKSNLTQRLGFMEKSGLVKKDREDGDGRRVVVSLTPYGQQRYHEALAVAQEYNRHLESIFDGPELETYFQFMEKLNVNIGKSKAFSC